MRVEAFLEMQVRSTSSRIRASMSSWKVTVRELSTLSHNVICNDLKMSAGPFYIGRLYVVRIIK